MLGSYANVFFYYRGPGSVKSAEDGDRQLEDNATKALINVLALGPPQLTESFLREVVGTNGATGGNLEYFLQGGPDSPKAPRRLLVGLTPDEYQPTLLPKAEPSGRIDAVIYAAGALLVAVETKITPGSLDPLQLARHQARWATDEPWISTTWKQVLDWASTERQQVRGVEAFLLGQLCELIEITGVAGFTGVQEADFRFFELEVADRTWEQQAVVKSRLRALLTEVLNRLDPVTVQSVGETQIHQLPLSADSATAQTNWRQPGANIDIGIDAGGVTLNVTGWLTDQARAVQSWLLSSEGERTLRSHDELSVKISCRRAFNYEKRGTGVRPWWQRFNYQHVDSIPAAVYETHRLQAILKRPEFADYRWARPAFHIRRRWSREEALTARSGLALAVASEVEVMARIKDEVNALL